MSECFGYDDAQACVDLRRLAHGSEQEAEEALGRLWIYTYPRLDRVLRGFDRLRSEGHYAEREDLITQTLLKILARRKTLREQGKSFVFKDMQHWRKYLTRICCNCYIDQIRQNGTPVGCLDPEVHGYDSWNTVLGMLADEKLEQKVRHTANYLWLGLDKKEPSEVHTRQQAAAWLYYGRGWDKEEIVQVLQGTRPDALDKWLEHPGVLRYLAYTRLYYSKDRLTASLLGVDVDKSDYLEKLNVLTNAANAIPPPEKDFDGFTWLEVLIVLWHYRHRDTPDQIMKQISERVGDAYSKEKYAALIARLDAQYPFKNQMEKLRSYLQRKQITEVEELFCEKEKGLWRRLVFEYRYAEGLTHKQIQQCTNPAAEQVGFDVSEAILIGWLCNKYKLEKKEEIRGALLYQLMKELDSVYGKEWRAER